MEREPGLDVPALPELGGAGTRGWDVADAPPSLEEPTHDAHGDADPVDHGGFAPVEVGGAAPPLESEPQAGSPDRPADWPSLPGQSEAPPALDAPPVDASPPLDAPPDAEAMTDRTIGDASDQLGLDRAEWIRDVDYESMGPGLCGTYDMGTREMTINRDLLEAGDLDELERTAAHETFHAYQNQEMWRMGEGDPGADPRAVDWAIGSGSGYVDPFAVGVTWDEYASQPLERDAFAFEDEFMATRSRP